MKVPGTLNNVFANTVKILRIKGFKVDEDINENVVNISKSVNKFNNHPIIIKVKEHVKTKEELSFSPSGLDEIENKISNLNYKKPTTLNTRYVSKYIFIMTVYIVVNSLTR